MFCGVENNIILYFFSSMWGLDPVVYFFSALEFSREIITSDLPCVILSYRPVVRTSKFMISLSLSTILCKIFVQIKLLTSSKIRTRTVRNDLNFCHYSCLSCVFCTFGIFSFTDEIDRFRLDCFIESVIGSLIYVISRTRSYLSLMLNVI